ncbi:MAG: hypothetical protein Q7S86_05290 [bacterium]|nr:hypothetical protein [bacterium]
MRVAISVAFLALCALILGLAAPPAIADTGQQHAVFTTAPPPNLDVGLVTSDIASPQKLESGVSATIGQSLAGSTLQFKVQPVIVDTSPPAPTASVAVNVDNNVEAVIVSPPTSKEVASIQPSVTSGQAITSNRSSADVVETITERTALGPESVIVAANTTIIQITTDAPTNTLDADIVGGQLATASSLSTKNQTFATG